MFTALYPSSFALAKMAGVNWTSTVDVRSTSMIIDTALALSALKSVNYSNQTTISNAILYLVTNQNTDGGWGFYAGDESNIFLDRISMGLVNIIMRRVDEDRSHRFS